MTAHHLSFGANLLLWVFPLVLLASVALIQLRTRHR